MGKKNVVDNSSKTPYNKRGFYTKNHTQDMGKEQFKPRQTVTMTTEEVPAGESGLPMLH